MSAAKRRRDDLRRKGSEPFASIRCDDLLSAACRLKPAELRVWLVLNANYVPPHEANGTGEAFIAYSWIVKHFKHGRSTIAAAFRGLAALGLIVLKRAGTRPRGQGAAAGEAAVWDLPSREKGERPKPPLPAGVERPWGKLWLNAVRLRGDLHELSPAATKVFAFALAHRNRSKVGALAENSPFALPTRQLARALGMSASGVAEAAAELVKARRLSPAEGASGRRPATYRLHPRYAKHEKRGGSMPLSPRPMVTTSGPGAARKSRKSGAPSVPVADARP